MRPSIVIKIASEPILHAETHASEIQRIASDLFPGKVKWAPVSPVCRENIVRAGPDLELLG